MSENVHTLFDANSDQCVEYLEECLHRARTDPSFGMTAICAWGHGDGMEAKMIWSGMRATKAAGLIARLAYYVQKRWDELTDE